MTGHGQCVIGVVTVIDIGDAEFDFEHCCRKGHAIVSTLVRPPKQSGRFGRWAAALAADRVAQSAIFGSAVFVAGVGRRIVAEAWMQNLWSHPGQGGGQGPGRT